MYMYVDVSTCIVYSHEYLAYVLYTEHMYYILYFYSNFSSTLCNHTNIHVVCNNKIGQMPLWRKNRDAIPHCYTPTTDTHVLCTRP